MAHSDHVPFAPLPAVQGLLTAQDPHALQMSMQDLNISLVTQPVPVIRDQSAHLREVVALPLMDYLREHLDALPDSMKSACSAALADYDALNCPVFPSLLTSSESQELVADIRSLIEPEEYEGLRTDILARLHTLPEAEQDAVSGYLSEALSDLLIRQAVPDCLIAENHPVAARQFKFWRSLSACEGYGLEQLSLYFLRAYGNDIEVLLPVSLEAGAGVRELYASAQIIAALGCQLTRQEKQTLLEMLHFKAELATNFCLQHNRCDEDAAAICSLFLALHASYHNGNGDFWEYAIYHDQVKWLKQNGKVG